MTSTTQLMLLSLLENAIYRKPIIFTETLEEIPSRTFGSFARCSLLVDHLSRNSSIKESSWTA